ncbi:N-Acetylneuraminate cytidylyltransferase [Fimbriiglobus ruber]|uniref:N-Acetylneuraminate cytidylyltransferase n=2 Tax=Fimbriiglobus ruber TaxID=1908690 RepID=A0A225DVN2_9BACT|nr:N-Acetylneuraminate cytidylyltransferase [Fimbriiglobus ruber]
MEVKRGPILFRCDATPEQGYEAFYQCLSLAAALQRRRRGTQFLSYLEPLSLAQVIHRGNNDWTPAESALGAIGDLDATLREVRRTAPAAVVVAGATATADYMAAIAETGTKVLALDNAAAIEFPCAIVVNPLLAPGMKAYRYQRGTQLLLGRKFALVRGVFRRQRTIRATEQPGPFRALVAFGDDDFADQTMIRTQQLLEMAKVDKISIACRTHHPRYHELRDLAEDSGGRVEVVTEPKELMTRLVRAHFALTSGDAWALEMCCVGIPQLVLPAQPAHTLTAKRMDDEGAATFLGAATDVTYEQLEEAIGVVLDDPMERLGMSRCARNLIDGRGGDRIVNGLEIILHSPRVRQPAQLRIAA